MKEEATLRAVTAIVLLVAIILSCFAIAQITECSRLIEEEMTYKLDGVSESVGNDSARKTNDIVRYFEYLTGDLD